jgi:hypothetical protein
MNLFKKHSKPKLLPLGPWKLYTFYSVGQIVSYGPDALYKCNESHIAFLGWTPDVLHFWKKIHHLSSSSYEMYRLYE